MKVLENCSTNSESELAELYRSHHDALLRQAKRITQNQADAEDSVQDAIVRLLERDLSNVTNLHAYLFTTTRHAAVTLVRRPIRMVPLTFEVATVVRPPPTQSGSVDLELHATLAGGNQRLAAIWSGLANGRTHAEIARDMETSPNAIKCLLWQARRRLKDHAPGGRRWS